MDDVRIRIEGRAGRITLARPEALNALTGAMVAAIDAALRAWADDPAVALVLIDAVGERAFCAGGDVAELYAAGQQGDPERARRFWRTEYRMNARIGAYPKPVVALLQGFVMGGGVGLGCHAATRVVGESAQIAMPECGIGLIPDVGGSLLLARAPGRLGEYLGLTGARIGPADAIHAGFADLHVPETDWPELTARLTDTGDPAAVARAAAAPPAGRLAAQQGALDRLFAGPTVAAIRDALASAQDEAAQDETAQDETAQDEAAQDEMARAARKAMDRASPLSLACALETIRRARAPGTGLRDALAQEYRFAARALEQGDFLEGVRAAVIDKDRAPRWRHAPGTVPAGTVAALLAPLGPGEEMDFDTEEEAAP